jgi:hypothetical protein
MYDISHLLISGLDADGRRTQLQKMSDEELLRFEEAACYMCSSDADNGEPPTLGFVLWFNEAREERTRRQGPATSAHSAHPIL